MDNKLYKTNTNLTTFIRTGQNNECLMDWVFLLNERKDLSIICALNNK
jgi:hypothetical protein